MVKIVHNGKTELVRALFDSGSQRSYLRKDIVRSLGLNPSDQETLSHNLFGGVETEFQTHGIFDIEIQSLEKEFKYKLLVLDKDKICGYIPRVKSQHISTLLRKHRIKINDSKKYTPEIGMLIGADYSGQLMTNNIIPIDKNLTAIETKLGWTLQGPVENQVALLSTIGLCNLDLPELWNLETISIKDPLEVCNQTGFINEDQEIQCIKDQGVDENTLRSQPCHEPLQIERNPPLKTRSGRTIKILARLDI